MEKILLVLCVAALLAGGCGGVDDQTSTINGCSYLSASKPDMFEWSRSWDCGLVGYNATCAINHHMGGVKITCECFESNYSTGEAKFGRGYIETSAEWNDNIPPDKEDLFIEYVQKIPECKWWAPHS